MVWKAACGPLREGGIVVEGTYFLQVDTPLGRKEGTAELVVRGNVLDARVDAPIIGKQQAAGVLNGNSFTANGEIKVPIKGKVGFALKGEVGADGILVAQLSTSKGDFTVFGARM